MNFSIEKYAMITMESGKRQITKGIGLPNQQRIRMCREKETYKYLGILGVDTIKQVKMKEKNDKRVPQTKPSSAVEISSKG